jgi:hypothetical protein
VQGNRRARIAALADAGGDAPEGECRQAARGLDEAPAAARL